ncbi:hypothetical protein [Wohlfahrtiimonas populi]|uniref:hypothetical protein n=1 Tax=Wohlfahrtiimonas populi TaxID=1940240 RepID=UPI00098D2AE7|nr:hypothetical protein [Wohlfahrtiimonas populi]
MKSQKSVKSVAQKYQRAIPNWVDNLPEAMQNMFLISQDMVRGKLKVDINDKVLEKYQKIQAKQTTRKIYALIGAVVFVSTMIGWNGLDEWLGGGLIVLAILAFYQALRE